MATPNLQDCLNKVTRISDRMTEETPTSESIKQLENTNKPEPILQHDVHIVSTDTTVLDATRKSIETALDETRRHIAKQEAYIEKFKKDSDTISQIVVGLTQNVDTLSERNVDLTKRVEQLEQTETDPVVGQIVSKANDCIIERIIEGTGISSEDSFLTIYMLDRAVKGKAVSRGKTIFNRRQVRIAKENWKKLDHEFSLNWNDYGALDDLRITRNFPARPPMRLEEARKYIDTKPSIPPKVKEMGEKLLRMLEQMSVTEI